MTRTALRRRVRPYRRALIEWFENSGGARLSRKLYRAGFRLLPSRDLGVERVVVIGPGIVVKTDGWRNDATAPRHRRSRVLAPTIKLGNNIVVQPLGRVMKRCTGPRWAAAQRRYEIARRIAEDRWGFSDTHDGNFALFPDRTVRCIDY